MNDNFESEFNEMKALVKQIGEREIFVDEVMAAMREEAATLRQAMVELEASNNTLRGQIASLMLPKAQIRPEIRNSLNNPNLQRGL